MANPRAASFATYRSLPDDQAALWDDIERVDQDPEIARKRVLVYHLDRQRMSPRRQAVFEEVRTLRSFRLEVRIEVDRKSTRLNSSHGYISYAVFCLKKKIIVKKFSPLTSTIRSLPLSFSITPSITEWCLTDLRILFIDARESSFPPNRPFRLPCRSS